MNTAMHVINETEPMRQDNKTPYGLWYGKLPGLEKLRIFSTECFAHIQEKTYWRREGNLIKKREK